MKKILNYKLFTVLAVLLIVAISCTKDFDTINQNNNRPTSAQAAPEMLLTNCVEALTDRLQSVDFGEEIGNGWIQHHAKVQYTDEDRYRPRTTSTNGIWTSFYASAGMDAEAIIKVATARGADYDNYKGVGLVLKCLVMEILTDTYGDVPYSEAFKAGPADGGILNPKYDTQESIYTDLLAKLEEANTLLDAAKPAILGDNLYGRYATAAAPKGNVIYWKKFANSLRLRLLLRMADRNSALVTTEMTKMLVTSPATYPIFTSNADNAALEYLGSSPNNHPINENRKTRDDHRISKTLVDMLYVNNLFVDWRIAAYAEPAVGPGDFVGLPNGLPSDDANNYLGNGLDQTSKLGTYFTGTTCPGQLMSYAELRLILAEAVLRSFVTGSTVTADQHYTAGVTASYAQFGTTIATKVPALWGAANATAWFGSATPTIAQITAHYLAREGAWPATTDAARLQRIGIERWIALFDQGVQAWIEWRRTNYPALVPAPAAFNPTIPQRLNYPPDEFSRNPINTAAAVAIQGADDLNTRVWWDVANNF